MSRNILNEGRIFINTITGGEAINISSTNSTSSTANVKISKQTAKTTPVNTDLFLLEESDGSIKKITYQNLESNIDTNFWTYSAPSLRPNNITDNVLIGISSNSDNRKLIVFGDTELGDIYMPTDKKIISKGDANDFVKFGNNVLTISYGGGVLCNDNLVMGSTADIILSTGGVGISRAGSSTNKIFFNDGNFTFGNMGIFNNSIQVKSTDNANSGSVSFFEARDNGENNIDLHCPLITTHDYNAFLPKITDTSITSVFILSNRNVLGGTNINISNATTDTITVNLDTTITGSITFSSTITGNITGNAGTATKISSITNSNIVQLDATQTLTNKTLKLPKILDTSDNHSYIFGVSELTANRTITLPLLTTNDTFVFENFSQTLTNKTLGSGTIYNGNTISVAYGGTGFSTYTIGDILYANTTTTLQKLAIGSANMFLKSNGSIPVWSFGNSFDTPLQISSNTVSLGGLSGFGNANQLIATANDSSNNLQYRTLTEGTNITISHTSSAITISSSENYWERNSNISSFDIQTTNTVDNIALTVPLSTTNTFVSTSSLKSTLGLISGGGEYIKFIDYSGTKPLELKGIINSSSQRTYHLEFIHDSTGTSYPLLAQDINGNLYFHWNALGDKFTFKTDGNSLMSGIISPTSSNDECFLSFGSTVLTNTFQRTDCVQLKIAANSSYASGTVPGYIELSETAASTSNTTRLYFNSAGTAFIYFDGTNLVATQNTFSSSDSRLKKNETLANTAELSNAFDKIEIYKYQYEEQYAIDKGADPNKYVYGFIAQNVKEQTDNLSSQFSSTGKGQGIYPNDKVDYEGDKLVVDNVLTINKTDMNLLLWAKIKEMDSIIKNQQIVINNLLSATTFANFKKM